MKEDTVPCLGQAALTALRSDSRMFHTQSVPLHAPVGERTCVMGGLLTTQSPEVKGFVWGLPALWVQGSRTSHTTFTLISLGVKAQCPSGRNGIQET